MARELPSAVQLEQSVLGSLMVYPNVIQDCRELDLRVDELYLPSHQQIYQAILDVHDKGQPIDMNTVVMRLQEVDQLESSQGADYIIRLADSAISSATSRPYIETIKNKAQLRNLIYVADKISEESYAASEDIDTILDDAEKMVMDVTRNRRGSDFESSSEIVNRVMNEIQQLRNMKGVTGIQTGYRALDRITNGFQRGDLIILAARPAMGKSALALNFASEVARLNADGAVAIFSLEMPSESMMKRLISAESKVYSDKLRSGNLSNDDMSKLYEAGSSLSERKIYIDDTSNIKVSQIFSKCRKLKSEHGSLSLVVIDYLQLITGTRADSRQQEVSDISRNLKILAKELECPVIALSQLSRKVEERTDHKPMLSDLRESGSIEQDADIVMFLYRANYYDKEQESKMETETVDLSLAKHRNGGNGEIQLAFQKNISKFTNIDKSSGDNVYEN